MEPTDRRAYLETIADTAQSDQARLKALELLDRLDERERQQASKPEPRDWAESLADDEERLRRTMDLFVEHVALTPLVEQMYPTLRQQIERRAEEIADERIASAISSGTEGSPCHDDDGLGSVSQLGPIEPSEGRRMRP